MADSKITALTSIGASTDPVLDQMVIVDVSDGSMAATGTTKKVTLNNLLACSPTATLASATITGDLTVRTNKLAVTSTGVGCGVASPLVPLHVETAGTGTTAFSNVVSTFRSQAAGRDATLQFSDGTNQATISMLSGALSFGTGGANTRYNIDSTGVATWFVAGSTAMTLNSTGLGVGVTPSAKLHINGDIRIEQSTTPVLDFYTSTTKRALIKGTSSELNINSLTSNPITFTIDTTERARIDASGNLLVGKTASSTTVAGSQVQPDGTHSAVKSDGNPGFFYNTTTAISGTIALFRSNGVTVGSISQDGTNTAYNNSSDYRLKESVQPLTGGLARVNALKPSIYKWKTNGKVGEGFLAHELAEVVPFAVTGEKDAVTKDGEIEPQQVDLSKVVPILVAAIKELSAEVNALKNA